MQSRWKLVSKTAYILNSSTTNQSELSLSRYVLRMELFIDIHRRYHLKDVIVGKIYFLLVRIKIKHMELSIIRRETTGSPPNQYNESETITKFEIMDGAPVKGMLHAKYFFLHNLTTASGETIPIRLFLGGFDLTPTFREVNKKFSTRYYLNLVLIDEENRRYFKQQVCSFFHYSIVLPSLSSILGNHHLQDTRGKYRYGFFGCVT